MELNYITVTLCIFALSCLHNVRVLTAHNIITCASFLGHQQFSCLAARSNVLFFKRIKRRIDTVVSVYVGEVEAPCGPRVHGPPVVTFVRAGCFCVDCDAELGTQLVRDHPYSVPLQPTCVQSINQSRFL